MNRGVKRTDFYNELSKEKREEYLKFTRDKIVPAVDNIYYSVFVKDDINDNLALIPLMQRLEELKRQYLISHQPQDFGFGLQLDAKSYKLYKYCLTQPDLYDIFILGYLPNPDTPRLLVQIRAHGLWVSGIDKMVIDAFNTVNEILASLNCTIDKCRESRIDYCYHTNILTNPEKVFSDRNVGKQMRTTMKRWHQTGRIESNEGKTTLFKDYFALGERRSNNIFIRFYNKGLEVIDKNYKSFFFELWHQHGLISFYDRYCLEYAYKQDNYDYIHKGKLLFYLEYGTDEGRKKEFELSIKNPKMTTKDFEQLAKKYMPEVTIVMNVEFETKRKFYYYSDNFIDTVLKYEMREGLPPQLYRLYRIIDNRAVFIEYLTSTTVCFVKKVKEIDENGKEKERVEYVSWWDRLRNTDLEANKVDEKLVREYSTRMDERVIKVRMINNVGSNAVYSNNIDSDFIEDISDMLSNLNDNHSQQLKFAIDGEIDSRLLIDYKTKKVNKSKRLKNKIRKNQESDK